MKRINFVYGVLCMMVLFAAQAHAGVWGTIKGMFVENAVQVIIAGIAGIVGLFWGGAKVWAKFAKETVDVALTTKDALDPDGPGGRKITAEEAADIGKEAKEAAEAGIEAYKSTKKDKK